MSSNKTVYKISQFFLYPTFLSSKLINTVFAEFTGAVQVRFRDTFFDTLSAAFTIPSHAITESSIVYANYSPFSKLHVTEFQI